MALTAVEPDDANIIYDFSDVCELQYPTYADGTAGPCFYMSLFAPGTLWNQPDPITGKHGNSTRNLHHNVIFRDVSEILLVDAASAATALANLLARENTSTPPTTAGFSDM